MNKTLLSVILGLLSAVLLLFSVYKSREVTQLRYSNAQLRLMVEKNDRDANLERTRLKELFQQVNEENLMLKQQLKERCQ